MNPIGIIGGTGLARLANLAVERRQKVSTPWGEPSAELTHGTLQGRPFVFLPRHGDRHTIPPHKINYRANIWALEHVGVKQIVAVAAVGGITPAMEPARVVIPDHLIDYTHGRGHTFFEEELEHVTHIDFTFPYTQALRERLLQAGHAIGLNVADGGVYGCTQGPRLETPAEIRRMERDDCDLVGMTGMPEAALARELGLNYACCAVIANWAAGKTDAEITMAEIEANLARGMTDVARLLEEFARTA